MVSCLWLLLVGRVHGALVSIPRSIYTFWEGPATSLVEYARDTWHRLAPEWTVIVLNQQILNDHIDMSLLPSGWRDLSVVHLADLIRLEVVASRGGVWLDASIALVAPLASWVPDVLDDGGMVGFDMDFQMLQAKEVSPMAQDWHVHFFDNGTWRPPFREESDVRAGVFENWAFGAPPGSRVVKLWRDEYRRAVATPGGLQAYCSQLVDEPDSVEFLHPSFARWLPYLTMHAALLRIRHRHPDLQITAHAAEEMALRHLTYDISWSMAAVQRPDNYILDGTGGAIHALARGYGEVPGPPVVGLMVKFRGIDRSAFECLLAYRAFSKDSPLAQIFNLPAPSWLWYVSGFEAKFGGTSDPFLLLLLPSLRFVCVSFYQVVRICENPMVWCLLALLAIVKWLQTVSHEKHL